MNHLATIIESGKQQGTFRKNLDTLILAELRFNELETMCSQRNEVGLLDLYRSQQEVFDHYLAGLVFRE